MTENSKGYDRRQDVGQKMFIGIITAILTTVFLGSLGLSVKNLDGNHNLEIRMAQVEQFVRNQDRLNLKLENFLEAELTRHGNQAKGGTQ